MTTFKIGQATIARIEETYGPTFPAGEIFPEWSEATLAEHGHWLAPNHYDAGKGLLKLSSFQSVDVFNRFHCVFIHAPSFARSSAIMPVLLPSGMALFFTACVSICCA